MDTKKVIRLALIFAIASCGGGSSTGGKVGATGGQGGDETGGDSGSGGSSSAGGSGGSVSTHPDASAEAGSGDGGSGGSDTGGSGGSTPESLDGSTGTGGSAGEGGSAGAGGMSGTGGEVSTGDLPPDALGWYEGETVPPNTLFGATKVVTCGTAPACMSKVAVKEGVECCSGGKKLSQLLRGKGGVVFNALEAPSDGMFDVTWWYHCGKSDNFGDTTCGGAPHTASGCRPHILEVNGTKLPKVYHFPCYPGSWGQIHAATTTIPLKSGKMNSIKVYATPGRDAADLDAIVVYPAGKGVMPNIPGTAN